jgi:hypothetical protein
MLTRTAMIKAISQQPEKARQPMQQHSRCEEAAQ